MVHPAGLPVAGLAHAKLVTSYVASGVIEAVRTERAAAMPGVIAVLTAADLGIEDGGTDLLLARRQPG